jgi:hypothetical protein
VTDDRPALAAVETRHAGCRFRSRLEARWAVFFDALGIRWEYEPQGFDLDAIVYAYRPTGAAAPGVGAVLLAAGHLGAYLPDFWLPRQRLWFEVKGKMLSASESLRLHAFALGLGEHERLAVFAGEIPRPDVVARDSGREWIYGDREARAWDSRAIYPDGLSDGWQLWCRCPACGSYDVHYEGRAERNHCACEVAECYTADDETIIRAYERARSARFEHGEAP